MISFNVQLSASQSRTAVMVSSSLRGGDIVTESVCVSPIELQTNTDCQTPLNFYCKTQYILELLLYLIASLVSQDN